jgi:hypothetical protein
VVTGQDEDLEYTTSKLHEKYETLGMTSNLTKTKHLSIGKAGHNLSLEGNTLQNTMTISSNWRQKLTGKDMIQKFWTG